MPRHLPCLIVSHQSPNGLLLIDAVTGEWRRLLPGTMSDRYRLSRDGRTLVIEHDVFDSDVWLMQSGVSADR